MLPDWFSEVVSIRKDNPQGAQTFAQLDNQEGLVDGREGQEGEPVAAAGSC